MHKHAIVALLFGLWCGCAGSDPELYNLRWTGREFIEEARAFERGMERNLPENELQEHARRTTAALKAITDSQQVHRAAFKADAENLYDMLTGCYGVGSPANADQLNACRFEIGKLERALEDMK